VGIGAQKNAPGAKGPRFDRACVGSTPRGMPAVVRANHPDGLWPVELAASEMAVVAPRWLVARAWPPCRLWAAAKRWCGPSRATFGSRRGGSRRAVCPERLCAGRVATPGRSSVGRVRENRTHGSTGESGNGPA
jgi:hypothetical protein